MVVDFLAPSSIRAGLGSLSTEIQGAAGLRFF